MQSADRSVQAAIIYGLGSPGNLLFARPLEVYEAYVTPGLTSTHNFCEVRISIIRAPELYTFLVVPETSATVL